MQHLEMRQSHLKRGETTQNNPPLLQFPQKRPIIFRNTGETCQKIFLATFYS